MLNLGRKDRWTELTPGRRSRDLLCELCQIENHNSSPWSFRPQNPLQSLDIHFSISLGHRPVSFGPTFLLRCTPFTSALRLLTSHPIRTAAPETDAGIGPGAISPNTYNENSGFTRCLKRGRVPFESPSGHAVRAGQPLLEATGRSENDP
jgi:hypothetical protein